jgi:Na+-driven multidrug efflux pump
VHHLSDTVFSGFFLFKSEIYITLLRPPAILLKKMEQADRLGTEKTGKLLLYFSVPSVISLVLNALYNMVGQIFIGQGAGCPGQQMQYCRMHWITAASFQQVSYSVFSHPAL